MGTTVCPRLMRGGASEIAAFTACEKNLVFACSGLAIKVKSRTRAFTCPDGFSFPAAFVDTQSRRATDAQPAISVRRARMDETQAAAASANSTWGSASERISKNFGTAPT